jgi:rfaE bifunctional protein kinase chain/domain
MNDWQLVLQKFADVRVLVAGDVMLDRYLWGTVSRVSPEAPVPVVKLEKTTVTAGGAANVAANVAALRAKPFLIGAVGADAGGKEIRRVLSQQAVTADFLITDAEKRPTTTKTRIVAHQQHVVRVDEERAAPFDKAESFAIWQRINKILSSVEVVILSDYAKGCLSETVLRQTIDAARKLNKAVLVDPKGIDYTKYNGATLLTPNKAEAAAASGVQIVDENSCRRAGAKLLCELEIQSLLVTLGEDGMILFERNREPKHFPAVARAVYDVTGAGDTVIATLACALGTGASPAIAAQIANAAAGLAVEQIGTTAVGLSELEKQLSEIQQI